MTQLLGKNCKELEELLTAWGQPRFRAAQLQQWLNRAVPFSEMANLPKNLREKLESEAVACPVTIDREFVSTKDGTRKYLFALQDGNLIEGVLMRYHYGNTLCISCQVGCRMGCRFCASTLEGCVRNLTASEMLGQVALVNRLEAEGDKRGVTNIVMMGSGEPLDAYEETLCFLRYATSPEGLGIAQRNISVSTCGIVPKILALAKENMQITLSLSLHAPNDEIRRQLMPVANAYTVEETLNAMREYVRVTTRRVAIEYALIRGVNDSTACAEMLAAKLRGMLCHVNLIPLNDVPERGLCAPAPASVAEFLATLEKNHISATIRRRLGDDIAGACGQLRRKTIAQQEETV